MGVVGKLVAIALVLIVSYILLAALLVAANTLVQRIGLEPDAPSIYNLAGGNLLQVSSATAVLMVFTTPALLSIFGKSGPWLRLLSKHAKSLLVTFGAAALIYVGATAAATVQTAPTVHSSGEPLVVLGVASLLSLVLLSPGTFLGLAEKLVGVILQAPSLLPHLADRRQAVAAIELRLTPTKEIRAKYEEKILQEEAIKFQRFARALVSMKLTTEFRMSFRERRGRIILLARGKDSISSIEYQLLSVAKTYLPETLPTPVTLAVNVAPRASILLTGAPEPSPNPLEPLARYFIENGYEGDYAVVFREHRGNPISGLIARRRQRALAKKAGQQQSISSFAGEQNTTSIQDHFFQIESEEAAKRVERHSSSQAVDAWVYITGRGTTQEDALRVATLAAGVARSSLSSHRKAGELKITGQRRPFQDLLPRGKPSIILPSEAASFVWIPQMAMGVEVAPAVEFELPPPLEGDITLGEVMLQSGKSGHWVKLPLNDLVTHLYLMGRTGSGKTTSAFNLLLQLYDLGVPFLVIEPVKKEYRSLASHVKSLQVFTPGEDTAPFRLNIFEPRRGSASRLTSTRLRPPGIPVSRCTLLSPTSSSRCSSRRTSPAAGT